MFPQARRLEHATPESSAALGVMRELFAGKKKVKAPPQREGKGKLSSLKLTDSGGTPSRQAAAGVKAGALRQPRPAFPSTLHPISRAVSSEVLVITPSTTEDTDERGDVEGRGDGEAETVGPDVLPAPLSAGDGTAPAPLEWSF